MLLHQVVVLFFSASGVSQCESVFLRSSWSAKQRFRYFSLQMIFNWTPVAASLFAWISSRESDLVVSRPATSVTFLNMSVLFQAPLWAYLLCAVGLFIYQSLDAIDGKQARRTNSSSPLGELFDHGCDSLSTGASADPVSGSSSPPQHLLSQVEALKVPYVSHLHSVRGAGNQYSRANGNQPRLDVLLLLRWDVYVLLRSLANLRVRDTALRHVSR